MEIIWVTNLALEIRPQISQMTPIGAKKSASSLCCECFFILRALVVNASIAGAAFKNVAAEGGSWCARSVQSGLICARLRSTEMVK